jgi:transcriptional regulator with XRE-family HTH domain
MEVVKRNTLTMNDAQAVKLGRLLAQARKRKGLSLRALAELTGFHFYWLYHVEKGIYNQPTAERLTRLAEVLDIDPERLDRITKGHLSSNLPGVRTYFRTKYELAPDEIDQIERTIKQIKRKQERREKNDNPNPTN